LVYSNGSLALGGGIFNTTTLTLESSSLWQNWAPNGGGLAAGGGVVSLANTTVSANRAFGFGGGLYAHLGALSLNNATVYSNTADADSNLSGDGGGLFVLGAVAPRLANSVLAGNFDRSPGGGQVHADCSGAVDSAGHNLVQSVAGCVGTAAEGDLTGLSPALAPGVTVFGALPGLGLLYPVHIHLPGPASPLLGAGSPAAPGSGPAACAPFDALGEARPPGLPCDIGAVQRPPAKTWLPLLGRP
jgi:hypothetical protein